MSNENFVPIEDVAKHYSVSISTIRAWVRQDLIPASTYIKAGSTYRFCISKVTDALTGSDTPEAPVLSDAPAEDDTPVQLELDFNNPDEDI